MPNLLLQRRMVAAHAAKPGTPRLRRPPSARGSDGRDTCRSSSRYDGDDEAHPTLCPRRKPATAAHDASGDCRASLRKLSFSELPSSRTPCLARYPAASACLSACRNPRRVDRSGPNACSPRADPRPGASVGRLILIFRPECQTLTDAPQRSPNTQAAASGERDARRWITEARRDVHAPGRPATRTCGLGSETARRAA